MQYPNGLRIYNFQPITRRYIQEGKYIPKRQYEELNQAESEFLDIILVEIQKLKPEVHKELLREKRFNLYDLDNWLGYLYKHEKYQEN